jgi:hypothetical protein
LKSNLRDSGAREAGTPGSSSNAAGLIAMARMRANLKKNTGRSEIFEA